MNYKETIEYINSITWIGSKLGLERTQELLAYLGNPQKQLKFIHIAGTNGKGSTASMLSSVLTQAGYKTGLFTSPYIERFNERMQIDKVSISDEELAEIATYVRPYAESMEDLPTEFELNTAIGIEYFKRNACDFVVLEVGMGGLLDSTNVIDAPELAIITAIGLDHVKELGGTIEAIARTKAGIIKEGCKVVVYGQDEIVEEAIKEVCKEKDAQYFSPEFDQIQLIGQGLKGQSFSYKGIKELMIPLAGTYQLNNAAVVLKALEVLKASGLMISEEDLRKGLAETVWPGRFEVLSENPVFIIDGAHNPHGIRATKESLEKHFPHKKIVFLLGIMADKEIDEMLGVILPIAREVITVTPNNPRALPGEELAQLIIKKGIQARSCDSIGQGVEEALHTAGADGIVCAIGSLYMIGDIRTYVKNK